MKSVVVGILSLCLVSTSAFCSEASASENEIKALKEVVSRLQEEVTRHRQNEEASAFQQHFLQVQLSEATAKAQKLERDFLMLRANPPNHAEIARQIGDRTIVQQKGLLLENLKR